MHWWQRIVSLTRPALTVDKALTTTKTKITVQQRRQIKAMRAGGMSLREIGRAMGWSHEQVRKVLRRQTAQQVVPHESGPASGGSAIAEATHAVREVAEFRRAIREVSDDDERLPISAPLPDFGPDPDLEFEREERRLQLEEKRAKLAARREFTQSAEYIQLVHDRMRRELQGSSRNEPDPIEALLNQRKRWDQVSELFGGGNNADRNGSWLRELVSEVIRQVSPYVGPTLAALATRDVLSVESPRPMAPPQTFVQSQSPFLQASPAAETPDAMPVAGHGDAPPATAAGAAVTPDPVSQQPAVGTASQQETLHRWRAVLLALARFADATPDQAAGASFDWLVAQEESDSPLAGPANELLALAPIELLAVVRMFRSDPDLGPLVQALEQNPAWALGFLVRLRELLAASEADDEAEPPVTPAPEPKKTGAQKGGKKGKSRRAAAEAH